MATTPKEPQMNLTSISNEMKFILGAAALAMFFAFTLGGLQAAAGAGLIMSEVAFIVCGIIWLTKYGP